MLFGYTMAIFAGFLLMSTKGWRIAVLLALWLGARLLIPLAGAQWFAATLDVALPPAVLLLRQPSLWRGWKWPTAGFIPLLIALSAANLAWHLEVLGITTGTADPALRTIVDLLILLLVVMAGRLIPGYTRAMFIPLRQPKDPGREKVSIVLAMLLLMTDLYRWHEGVGLAAIALAALQAWRLSGWRTVAVFRHPILLVLHIGFGWLALGLVLRGVAAFTDWLPDTDALHAVTIGAIGMLTLGMAGRLLRMHGRRPLTASAFEICGYASLFLATAFRALMPIALPELRQISIPASALFWILAFVFFLLEHAPALGRSPKSSAPLP
jgi:uncharacterized protein involved in response to NO